MSYSNDPKQTVWTQLAKGEGAYLYLNDDNYNCLQHNSYWNDNAYMQLCLWFPSQKWVPQKI